MGIKDTEQDRTMMDGPERSRRTGEGREEGGMKEMGGDTEKMEICVSRKEEAERERLEESTLD